MLSSLWILSILLQLMHDLSDHAFSSATKQPFFAPQKFVALFQNEKLRKGNYAVVAG
jgi:hypothetical protein